MKPEYCINDLVENCQACSYANYGRDCQNNPIARGFTIEQIGAVLNYPEPWTRKLLNDSGANIDELAEDPGELIPREAIINMIADRAGKHESRKLSELLTKG